MGCQERSATVIPPTNSTPTTAGSALCSGGATIAITTTQTRSMNAIMEAMVSGILFFTRPAYPHPVPYACSREGVTRSSGDLVLCRERWCEEREEEEEEEEGGVGKEERVYCVPRLPPELYSIIAYHCLPLSSTTLLNSCSLTSSAWLTASRTYTFHTIHLTYTNIYPFLDLLENSKCSFRRCVRRVEMREGEYAVDRWMDEGLPRLVRVGVGMFEGVEVVDLYNLSWAELGLDAVRALTHGFGERDKKSLRVGTCYWECVHDFFGFVSSPSFAGLRTLICDSVLLNCGMGSCRCWDVEKDLVDDSASWESVKAEFPRMLENLYLGSPEEKMLRWFVKEDAVRGLEKLGLVVRERMLVDLVGQLVGRATEVKELALDLPTGCGLSLVNNTHLRSLRVHVDLSSFSSSSSSPLTLSLSHTTLAWLLNLISSISSPHIHLLILHLDLTVFSIGDFRSLWPWRDFIKAINGLESMKRVVFIVAYSRRRTFNALKEVIRGKTLGGLEDAIGCEVRVRGVRSSFPNRRDSGSEVWTSWI